MRTNDTNFTNTRMNSDLAMKGVFKKMNDIKHVCQYLTKLGRGRNVIDLAVTSMFDKMGIPYNGERVIFLDVFHSVMYIYLFFYLNLASGIKRTGVVTNLAHQYKSLHFNRCNYTTFQKFFDDDMLKSCQRGFWTMAPFFFKQDNVIQFVTDLKQKLDMLKRHDYLTIPIYPSLLKIPNNGKGTPQYFHKQIMKRLCDKVICSLAGNNPKSKYKTHIKGRNLYIANPFNPFVYSNIIKEESSLRLDASRVLSIVVASVFDRQGIRSEYRKIQGLLGKYYHNVVHLTVAFETLLDREFGIFHDSKINQVGKTNMSVAYIYVSSLFSIVTMGDYLHLRQFTILYCKFMKEFQYVPENKRHNIMKNTLQPLKRLIDDRARVKVSATNKQHFMNIYTNFIKLLYIYVNKEATLSSAFLEFPVKTYNPYKRNMTIHKNDELVIAHYVEYIMDKSKGIDRKRDFNDLIVRILEQKHSKLTMKTIRIGSQILKGVKLTTGTSRKRLNPFPDKPVKVV